MAPFAHFSDTVSSGVDIEPISTHCMKDSFYSKFPAKDNSLHDVKGPQKESMPVKLLIKLGSDFNGYLSNLEVTFRDWKTTSEGGNTSTNHSTHHGSPVFSDVGPLQPPSKESQVNHLSICARQSSITSNDPNHTDISTNMLPLEHNSSFSVTDSQYHSDTIDTSPQNEVFAAPHQVNIHKLNQHLSVEEDHHTTFNRKHSQHIDLLEEVNYSTKAQPHTVRINPIS